MHPASPFRVPACCGYHHKLIADASSRSLMRTSWRGLFCWKSADTLEKQVPHEAFRVCVSTRAIPSGFTATSVSSRHSRAGLMNAVAFAAGFWPLLIHCSPRNPVLAHTLSARFGMTRALSVAFISWAQFRLFLPILLGSRGPSRWSRPTQGWSAQPLRRAGRGR
jgi:hypothetical protein